MISAQSLQHKLTGALRTGRVKRGRENSRTTIGNFQGIMDPSEPLSTLASAAASATPTTSDPPSRPESPSKDYIVVSMVAFDGDL